jgi:2-desacetyl-2-hydroxyethyl bacteriochlorophyllide A dehydrogenase
MGNMPGCFAEFVAVPATHVHEISEHIPDAKAILAEPLANIVHLFRLSSPPRVDRIGIIGAGVMGSLALRLARSAGISEVLVEDVCSSRVENARAFGATLAVNADDECESSEALRFAGRGLDLVIDACGTQSARQRAFDLCRSGGHVALLGLASGRSEIDFTASIYKEHRVTMSFGYTPEDFADSLDLLKSNACDLTSWTEELPLEDGQRAFERMSGPRGATLKMLLRVQ